MFLSSSPHRVSFLCLGVYGTEAMMCNSDEYWKRWDVGTRSFLVTLLPVGRSPPARCAASEERVNVVRMSRDRRGRAGLTLLSLHLSGLISRLYDPHESTVARWSEESERDEGWWAKTYRNVRIIEFITSTWISSIIYYLEA